MKTMLTQLAPLASFLITEGIEGFRTESYDDATGKTLGDDDEALGVVTIGAGTTRWEDGTLIAPGSSITYQEGQDLLLGYLRTELAPAFARLIKVKLNETQAAAFGSFLYNFGETKAKGYTLTKLINKRSEDEVIARQWMKYVYSGGKKVLGLYRRRMAEVLLWLGLDWRAALNVDWDDDVMDVAMRLGYEPESSVEDDLFDDDYDPTPDTALTTADLNHRSLERISGKKIPLTRASKRVPIEAVDYIENPEPQVKRIEDSKRGKGYAKTQTGTEIGVAGVAGTAAVAVGAVEPVVSFVDRYPKETILWVFVTLTVLGLIYYMYGKWQRERGEDEATDLLG